MSAMDFKGFRGSSYVRGIALNVPPRLYARAPAFSTAYIFIPSHPSLAWPISTAPAKAGKFLDVAVRLYSFRPHNLK
jgi:hypothetical protein